MDLKKPQAFLLVLKYFVALNTAFKVNTKKTQVFFYFGKSGTSYKRKHQKKILC